MRIYRSVCTYIWNDDKFPFVSDDCQLVWFHLFTNPLSSPLGIYKASIAGLAEDKNRNGMWSPLRYKKAFEEALRQGFIEYDEKALLVAFPKYFSTDHECNHPQSPNVVLSWGKRFNELPSSPLKLKCYQALKSLLEGMHEGYMKAFTKGFREVSPKTSPNTDPNPNPNPDLNSLSLSSSSLSLLTSYSEEQVMCLWNLKSAAQCKKLGGPIRVRVRNHLKQHPNEAWWIELFDRVQRSDFLSGRAKDFIATLDWVLGPKNLAKIEAGNYDNRQAGSGYDAMMEAFVKS
jgi:hypothetical protein